MGIDNLNEMFHPKSVAVIGASDNEGSVGFAIMRNLDKGYTGKVYPINPRPKIISGVETCRSVLDIKSSIDLAIMAAPIRFAPQIVKECKEAGVKGIVIISAGGKEVGQKGKELEIAIKKAAGHSGLRIIGPNCLGIICSRSGFNASFARYMPLPGKLAFISQSGAICTSILDLSMKEQIGFSHFISLGSMLDVDFGDIVDYLGGDPDVSSIIMYVEGLSRFRNFMSAARAVSRVKPIIALKSGCTRAGAQAAVSHTGALAGEDAVYDSAFKRAGIVRVKTFEELFDCAGFLAKQPRPSGPGIVIITNAGGPGVMAADALSDYNMEPVSLNEETIRQLDKLLPPYWSGANPVDILGDATPERYRKVAEICLNAPEVNGLLIMLSPLALIDPAEVAGSLVDLLQKNSCPVFTAWIGGPHVEKGRRIFNQAGIPTFDSPERAVRAFKNLYCYSQNLEMLQEIPPKLHKKLVFDHEKAEDLISDRIETKNYLLTEVESKKLLSFYGIPVNQAKIASSDEEAVKKAQKIGFPVVMKVCSRDITHKTDANGIRLNLLNENQVRQAFADIMASAVSYNPNANIEGVTIQSMITDSDYEIIIGAKKDRDFGPVILFGMGGIMAEVLNDQALALPPLNRLLAQRLMQETRIYRLLKGFRNHPPANLMLIEEILVSLSQLVTDFPEIEELDINPLIVKKNDVCAVDARILLKESTVPAPLHLIISPYPNQYEAHIVHKDIGRLFIRPIRPDDASLLVELFEALSPRSVYFRFFGYLKYLPHKMLARFTQIDYDREAALVALNETETGEKILAVARVMVELNPKNAEFAILVGDPWQGKGIGAELLKRCLSIAKERGIETIWGLVLAENTQMLDLGRKLGFKVKLVPNSNEYELKLDLKHYQDR